LDHLLVIGIQLSEHTTDIHLKVNTDKQMKLPLNRIAARRLDALLGRVSPEDGRKARGRHGFNESAERCPARIKLWKCRPDAHEHFLPQVITINCSVAKHRQYSRSPHVRGAAR